MAHRKDADGKIQAGPTRESLIDRQIREAQEEGQFDNLPHQGAPLPNNDNPLAGDWALAYHMLKNAGVAPPSTTDVAAHDANVGVDPFADSATGPLVWLVFLNGNFALPACPPESEYPDPSPTDLPSCIWKEGGLTAVLDLFTGQLIGWQAS